MNRGRRVALSAAAGVLLAVSFPKVSLAAAAFVALVPLLLALDGVSPRRGFVYGQVTGTVQGFLVLFWVGDVLSTYGGASRALAVLLTLLLAVAFGLFLGAFGALQAQAGRAWGPRALLLAPFFFVACEFMREHLLFGFPWCLLGYSQVNFTEFIQIAALTSVHGVSFLLVASSAGLAHAYLAPTAFERRLGLTLPAILLSAAMAFGHARLQRPIDDGAAISVGLIQASIPQDQKWVSGLLETNIDRHVSLSRQAVKQGARMIVWPESAIGFELDLYPEVLKQVSDFAALEGVYLLTGNDDRERDVTGVVRSYVGAKLISPSGEIVMRYRKMRLVPFGEYLPMASMIPSSLPVKRLVESVSDFTPGTEVSTGRVYAATIAAFICYEAIFPSLVRRFPLNGAEILFNLTNDGWYGTSAAPYQHYAMARFRAVENHRFLVRAANTGFSAIIDPFGRELARSDLMEARALVGEVRAVSEVTFYARHGDVFAWSVVGVSLLALGAALLGFGRSHKLNSPETPSPKDHERENP